MVGPKKEEPSLAGGDRMNLAKAAASGDLKTCKLFLKNGADIHTENDEALRLAAENGHLETCKWLLENGADIHAN